MSHSDTAALSVPEDLPRRAPARPLADYLDRYAGDPLWQYLALLSWLLGRREDIVLARTELDCREATEVWHSGVGRVFVELGSIEQRLVATGHEAGFSGGDLHAAIRASAAALHEIMMPLPSKILRRWVAADRVEVARQLGWPDDATDFGDDLNEWVLFRRANAQVFDAADAAMRAAIDTTAPIVEIARALRRIPPASAPDDDRPHPVTPKGNRTPKGNKIATAIGLLPTHGHLTNPQIAELVGCHPKSLSRNQKFRAARAAIRKAGKQELRRSKARGSDMDEYPDCD